MIKAIIFDCFGVLAESGWQTLERELSPSKEQWRELLDISHQCDLGLIEIDELLDHFSKLLSTTRPNIERILEDQNKNTDILDLIITLKPTYKIGMLSNVGRGFIQDFFTEDELAQFNQLTLSSDVKLAKPDPKIYKLAAMQLDVEVEECIFIDDAEQNVMAAQEQGMTAHQYTSFEELKKFLTNTDVKLAR